MAAIARLGIRLGRSFDSKPAGQDVATHLYDALGRRTTMIDWGGTSTYSFDALGRQSGQTDAAGFVQAYTHDETGNRTGLNLVGTGRFTFTFDSLNRLATAQKPGDQRYTLSYDADSRRTTMMLGNGSTRQYQFDARSQLATQIEFSAASVPIVTLLDAYDPVGNRMSRSVNGTIATWTYDDLYRLKGQIKPSQVATYSLDGVGNLKTMWEGGNFPKTFAFDAADRLATMTEGANLTTYTWTGYGALASEITGTATTAYAYSGQDQLIGVTPPTGFPSTYSFDGDGLRRTAQERNAEPTTMVWDGSDYLLLRDPSSDQLVMTLDGEIVSCGVYDLLPDSLGSVIGYTQAGANPTTPYSYWPYGRAATLAMAPRFPFGYVGSQGYYTDSTDRDYVRARELRKTTGRWMQVDPLWPQLPGFIYCYGHPIVNTDPTGKTPNITVNCSGTRNGRSDERYVRDAVDKLCSMGASQMTAISDCLRDSCPKFSGDQDCISNFCNGSFLIIINCIGRFGGNCTSSSSSDCAQFDTSFWRHNRIITLCGCSLPSKGSPAPCPRCQPLECVLMHELLHSCNYDDANTLAAGTVSPSEACRCFNCINQGLSYCDGFFAYGGVRYRGCECDSLPN